MSGSLWVRMTVLLQMHQIWRTDAFSMRHRFIFIVITHTANPGLQGAQTRRCPLVLKNTVSVPRYAYIWGMGYLIIYRLYNYPGEAGQSLVIQALLTLFLVQFIGIPWNTSCNNTTVMGKMGARTILGTLSDEVNWNLCGSSSVWNHLELNIEYTGE